MPGMCSGLRLFRNINLCGLLGWKYKGKVVLSMWWSCYEYRCFEMHEVV